MPVTLDQIKKGSRSESLNFGWMEVVSDPYPSGVKQGGWKVDVRFDDTGTVRRGVQGRYFTGGYVRDGSVVIDSPLSKEFQTFDSGIAKIIEYRGTKNVTVEFLNSGNVQKVQLDALVSGAIRDQSLDEYVREQQKCFDEMVRKARAEADRQRQEEKRKIEAELKAKRAQSQSKRAAEIKKAEEYKKKVADSRAYKIANLDKLFEVESKILDKEKDNKGVLNIDFKDRDGKWVLRFQMNGEFIQTRLGKTHNNMTQRVKKGNDSDGYYKSYANVSISESFKDAQKFCDWAVVQKGWGLGYNLDKDLLSSGNKIYSEETCVFLPYEINTALVLFKHGGIRMTDSEGFQLEFCLGGLEVLVPGFNTEADATNAYCEYRENYIKKLATEYREAISEKAYNALMNWKLIVTD
jgi:hypothetical protein